MSGISEHYSKNVRERNNSEQSWIYFLVGRDAIGVNDLLKRLSESISFYICRRGEVFKGDIMDSGPCKVLILELEIA
jgi:hypothetical protein